MNDQAVLEYVAREIQRRREADQKLREDKQLRLAATLLVEDFSDLLMERATQMSESPQSDPTPFIIDQNAELLLWQFVEFLTQGLMDKEIRDVAAKPHQLTTIHAGHWFGVSIDGEDISYIGDNDESFI